MALLERPDRQRGFNKERIIRVLLNHASDSITKYRVAKLAETSESWTRQYTSQLEDQGLLDNTHVLNRRQLYEIWLNTRIPPNQATISLQQPMAFLQDTDLDYALTTYRAENLQQGLLFPSTTDFYIPPDQVSDWLTVIKDNALLGGGNTRIRVLDDHVFYNRQTIHQYTTVSMPQLILDLLEEGGPCEEAAENLIEQFHDTE